MLAQPEGAQRHAGRGRPDEERLLKGVQDYLRQQLQGRLPDALLAHCWDEFYAFYDRVVRGIAAQFHIPRDNLDDVIQEVWIAIITHLQDFRWNENRPGLRAWLACLVRSKTVDQLRRRLRCPEQTTPSDSPLDTPLPELDPAWLFEQRWQQEVLRVASDELRAELSPENLQIFEGRLVQGLPVAEIASTLQMTSEQIWSRQRWLCRRLRARLDLYTGNPFGFEENTKSA